MDAQSNSLEQDSSDRPTDTQKPSFEPRKKTMQGVLERLAHLRQIQQQGSSRSVEAPGSTEDQDDVTAQAQKDTSSSSQTPGAQVLTSEEIMKIQKNVQEFLRSYFANPHDLNKNSMSSEVETDFQAQPPKQTDTAKSDNIPSQAQNQSQASPEMPENPAPAQIQKTCQSTLTLSQERQVEPDLLMACSGQTHGAQVYQDPLRAEYPARQLAQTKEGPFSSTLPMQVQHTPSYTSKLAYVQYKIKSMELSMAKGQFEKWNAILPIDYVAIEMYFKKRLEDYTKSQGVELRDIVFTPIRFSRSPADAQAHYEALFAEFRNTYQTQAVANPMPVQNTISAQDQYELTAKDSSRSSETLKAKAASDVQPSTEAQNSSYTSKLAYVQYKVKSMELSMAKGQFEKWNAILPIDHVAMEMYFKKRLEDYTKSQGVELRDIVFTPIRFSKSPADAQAHYEALLAEFRNTYQTQEAANPMPVQNTISTQDQYDLTAKDSSRSSETIKDKAAPDVKPSTEAQNPSYTSKLAYVQNKIKNMELSLAKVQFEKWDAILPIDHVAMEMYIKKRLENYTKSQGVELRDVVITPIRFSKSPADAQAHYEALLAEFRNTYRTQEAGAQAKGNHQAQPPKQTESQIQASPQDPAQTRSTSEKTENPAKTQTQKTCQLTTQVLNQEGQVEAKERTSFSNLQVTFSETQDLDQDSIPVQTQKGTSQKPADTQEAPQAQQPAQDSIQSETPPQSKPQTPHPKLDYVQSTVKVNEVALAKFQVAYYPQCNSHYWEITEKRFVESMKSFAKNYGVDPQDVAINPVSLAKSRDEAQRQFELLFYVAHDRDHFKIAKRTAAEVISLQGYLVQDQIALLKKELAETRASQNQTLKEFNAKSVENQLLKTKLCEEERTSIVLRASLEESEQEVEKLRKELQAKSKLEVKKTIAEEEAKAQRHAEVSAAIQATVQETFKVMAENKAKSEAEEKARIEAKAQIYAEAYVKAKTEAKAKARAEGKVRSEAKEHLCCSQLSYCARTLPEAQTQVHIKNLYRVTDQLMKSHRNSSQNYQEQIRCLNYDIQKLKKEVAEKDEKILEMQKELWKVIDERQVAKMDVEKLRMQLCSDW